MRIVVGLVVVTTSPDQLANDQPTFAVAVIGTTVPEM